MPALAHPHDTNTKVGIEREFLAASAPEWHRELASCPESIRGDGEVAMR